LKDATSVKNGQKSHILFARPPTTTTTKLERNASQFVTLCVQNSNLKDLKIFSFSKMTHKIKKDQKELFLCPPKG
jgi:hypothetical protein